MKLSDRIGLLVAVNFLVFIVIVNITFVFLVDKQWILAALAAIGGYVVQWLTIRGAWLRSWTEERLKTDVWHFDKLWLSIGIAVTLVGWLLMLTSSGFFPSTEQGSYTAGGIGFAGLVTLIAGYYLTVFSWKGIRRKRFEPRKSP